MDYDCFVDRMSGVDAGFWFLHEANPMFVGAVIEVETGASGRVLGVDDLRSLVARRAGRLKPLFKTVWVPPLGLGIPYWLDAGSPDLDLHVVQYEGEASSPTDVEAITGSFLTEDLPLGVPAWQLMLVGGGPSKSYILAKVHHALLDGQLGMELLGGLLDLSEHESEVDEVGVMSPSVPPSDLIEGIILSVGDLLERRIPALLSLAGRVRIFFSDRDRQREDLMRSMVPLGAPKCEISGSISKRREARMLSCEFSEFSKLAEAFSATINELLLAWVAGALRKYHLQRGAQIEVDLVALVPISTRHVTDLGESRNRISGMLVRLETSEEETKTRVRDTVLAARLAKEIADAVGPGFLLALADVVASPFLGALVGMANRGKLFDSIRSAFNLTVSNLSGLELDLYVSGHRVTSVTPFGPISDGAGLNLTVFTYLGMLHLGLLCCPEVVSDPDLLIDCLTEELADLVLAAATVS